MIANYNSHIRAECVKASRLVMMEAFTFETLKKGIKAGLPKSLTEVIKEPHIDTLLTLFNRPYISYLDDAERNLSFIENRGVRLRPKSDEPLEVRVPCDFGPRVESLDRRNTKVLENRKLSLLSFLRTSKLHNLPTHLNEQEFMYLIQISRGLDFLFNSHKWKAKNPLLREVSGSSRQLYTKRLSSYRVKNLIRGHVIRKVIEKSLHT